MAKKPEKNLPPPESKLGPIPPEHFDDDLPFSDAEPEPGGAYDALTERDKKSKKK